MPPLDGGELQPLEQLTALEGIQEVPCVPSMWRGLRVVKVKSAKQEAESEGPCTCECRGPSLPDSRLDVTLPGAELDGVEVGRHDGCSQPVCRNAGLETRGKARREFRV